MADFKVALEALVAEAGYVGDMALAMPSLSGSIKGLPGQVGEWGCWGVIQGPLQECFDEYDETVSTSGPALADVSELLIGTARAYAAAEAANTVDI